MASPANRILFLSDLSINMKKVFEQAATLAVCQDATIVILHVMENEPGAEKRVRMAFGEQLYENLKSEQKQGARNVLIGKNVDALKIRQAMAGFFQDTMEKQAISKEDALIEKILVGEGMAVIDEIISTIEDEECDMIVMGCRQQGLLSEVMGDKLVKKVIKRSNIPVLVVPYSEQES